MYFCKQVVDFFFLLYIYIYIYIYIRSAEAVKKGQIVKDTGISTIKKLTTLETFGWKQKTLGKRVLLEALFLIVIEVEKN